MPWYHFFSVTVQVNGGVLPTPPEASTLGSDRTAPTGQSEADDD